MGFRALKKPLSIISAIAIGLLLLYLLWKVLSATLFASGLPNWIRYYVPNNTQLVGYFNVDKFRKTPLYDKIKGHLPSRSEIKRSQGLRLHPDEIQDVFVIFEKIGNQPRQSRGITILRTHQDLPLDKVVSKIEKVSQTQEYKGLEYILLYPNGECYAKTGTSTYCIASSEDMMETTVEKLNSKQFPNLDKDIQSAIKDITNNDFYVAMASSVLIGEHNPDFMTGMPKKLRRAIEGANYMTGYLAFSSSPTIGWSVSFENQSNAEDYKDAIEAIGSLVDPDDMPIPPAVRKIFGKIFKMYNDGNTITQKGCLVSCRLDLKMPDIEDLIHEIHMPGYP